MRKEILTKEDKNTILEIKDCKLFNDNIKTAVNNLRLELVQANDLIKEQENTINILNIALLEILKTKIGEKIYWAHKNWKNYETHTITNVKYEVYNSDFFDKKDEKYKGKKLVIIEIDNTGTYLACHLGKTLFLTEEEAKLHISN
jgi:hypothetical protein